MKYYEKVMEKIGLNSVGNPKVDRFRISLFRDYQGVREEEGFWKIVAEKAEELIPLYSYGVELEGGYRSSKEELALNIESLFKEKFEKLQNVLQDTEIVRINGYTQGKFPFYRIGSDSSVRVFDSAEEGSNLELNTPSLIGWGMYGFQQIKFLLEIWNEEKVKVNRTCGGHVHVSAYKFFNRRGVEREKIAKLLFIFYVLQEFFMYLVPPSRRNNSYCRMLELSDVKTILNTRNWEIIDRYMAINFKNLSKNSTNATIEFRLWPSTCVEEKLAMHIIISLKVVERAISNKWEKFIKLLRELLSKDKEKISIENFCDLLGIEPPHPVLQRVREYIKFRFQGFYNDEAIETYKIKQKVEEFLTIIFSEERYQRYQRIFKDLYRDLQIVVSQDSILEERAEMQI